MGFSSGGSASRSPAIDVASALLKCLRLAPPTGSRTSKLASSNSADNSEPEDSVILTRVPMAVGPSGKGLPAPEVANGMCPGESALAGAASQQVAQTVPGGTCGPESPGLASIPLSGAAMPNIKTEIDNQLCAQLRFKNHPKK